MRELELLLKLADATEVEFFRGMLRDMRARYGDKETLDTIDQVCAKLSETNSTSVKELIAETQKLRDAAIIGEEYEKWNEAQRQRNEQEKKFEKPEWPKWDHKGPWKFDKVQKRGWEW